MNRHFIWYTKAVITSLLLAYSVQASDQEFFTSQQIEQARIGNLSSLLSNISPYYKDNDYIYDEQNKWYIPSPDLKEALKNQTFEDHYRKKFPHYLFISKNVTSKNVEVTTCYRLEQWPFSYPYTSTFSGEKGAFNWLTFAGHINLLPPDLELKEIPWLTSSTIPNSISDVRFHWEPFYTITRGLWGWRVHIDHVNVVPEWQRNGLGKLGICKIMDLVSSMNTMPDSRSAVIITTSARTPISCALFRKVGFIEVPEGKPFPIGSNDVYLGGDTNFVYIFNSLSQ